VRGTGILNIRLYVGKVAWAGSAQRLTRSSADGNRTMPRRLSHRQERLRIVPQSVWDDVTSRQLIARVAPNREISLQAAGSAPGCPEIGSGGEHRTRNEARVTY
jgi:hypothetical protein